MVLAFQTDRPLLVNASARDPGADLVRLLQNVDADLGKLLASETLGAELGAPIAGTFFHVRRC